MTRPHGSSARQPEPLVAPRPQNVTRASRIIMWCRVPALDGAGGLAHASGVCYSRALSVLAQIRAFVGSNLLRMSMCAACFLCGVQWDVSVASLLVRSGNVFTASIMPKLTTAKGARRRVGTHRRDRVRLRGSAILEPGGRAHRARPRGAGPVRPPHGDRARPHLSTVRAARAPPPPHLAYPHGLGRRDWLDPRGKRDRPHPAHALASLTVP